MTFEQLLILITATQQKNITPAQELVLWGAWHGQTYSNMAKQSVYEPGYLKTTAARLWQMISQLLDMSITKATLRSTVAAYSLTPEQQRLVASFKQNSFKQNSFKQNQSQNSVLSVLKRWGTPSDSPIKLKYFADGLKPWSQEYQQIQHFGNQYKLNQLVDRLGFDRYIANYWSGFIEKNWQISLAIGDLDFLKIYYQSHGETKGNYCLQKVAEILIQVVHCSGNYPGSVTARFDREEFVILLPDVTAEQAVEVAESIREKVKALGFTHDHSVMGGLPDVLTMSLGVASINANSQYSPDWLIQWASKALEQAKKHGRDRTSVYQPGVNQN